MDPSDSGTPPKTPLPFSMSGDGIEDVRIPSVFMKKADVESLLDVVRQSRDAVVVKLAPRTTKDEGEEGKGSEGEEGRGDEGGAKEVLRVESVSGQTMEEVSQHLQKLLEGLDPDLLTDKLKDSVAEELQKLKTLNSGQIGADSANVAEEVLKLKSRNSGQSADSVDVTGELRTLNSEQSGADMAEELPGSCADSTHIEEPHLADSEEGLRAVNSGDVSRSEIQAQRTQTEMSRGSGG